MQLQRLRTRSEPQLAHFMLSLQQQHPHPQQLSLHFLRSEQPRHNLMELSHSRTANQRCKVSSRSSQLLAAQLPPMELLRLLPLSPPICPL